MGMINFGSVNGRRCVTFRVSEDGNVVPAKWRGFDAATVADIFGRDELITARESFRRWKIARKAWQSRKLGRQLLLKLTANT